MHLSLLLSLSLLTALALKKEEDRKEIVMDEVCGYLLATFGVRKEFSVLFFSFLLFRVLDILKPGLLKGAHRVGGVGILLDDLLCGLFTNLFVRVLVR